MPYNNYPKLFLLILALFISCCKEKDHLNFFTTGADLQPFAFVKDTLQGTALKEVPGLGSINWVGNTLGLYKEGELTVSINTYEDTLGQCVKENLFMGNFPLREDVFVLGNDYPAYPSARYHRLDCDVSLGSWELDESQVNCVQLSNVDTLQLLVRGTFNLHFKLRNYDFPELPLSERINFKNGQFTVRYMVW